MADDNRIVRLTDQEHGIVVNALYEKHNDLVRRKGPFEAVDQVLIKVLSAKSKRGGVTPATFVEFFRR